MKLPSSQVLRYDIFLFLANEDPAEEESEFFLKADFNVPIDYTKAKLLYFLSLGFTDIDVAFGAGIFLNLDKAHGMRKADDPSSTRYGRLSLDDMSNRVPRAADLFVICAAGKLFSNMV